MPIYDNVNGAARIASKIYDNVNGAGRLVNNVYDNINGAARECHTYKEWEIYQFAENTDYAYYTRFTYSEPDSQLCFKLEMGFGYAYNRVTLRYGLQVHNVQQGDHISIDTHICGRFIIRSANHPEPCFVLDTSGYYRTVTTTASASGTLLIYIEQNSWYSEKYRYDIANYMLIRSVAINGVPILLF